LPAQGYRRRLQQARGHGDLFEQAGALDRRARPDAGHLDEQRIERQRRQHGGEDGQGDPPAQGIAAQQPADHERVTLAVNR
jgi:hypothetical protein